MNQDRTKLKLSAILSADVVGYSRLMEEDQAWTIKNLEENKTLISELVDEYKGRVVDAPGDNVLAEFNSITNAVECAVKIQSELKKKNSKLIEKHRMEFRIGINLGEVFEENGKIYGSGVNIAARMEGLSKSGGICISGRTYDHVKDKFDFGYENLGEHNVKNISEPIRVYRVLMDSKSAGKVIGEKKRSGGISGRTIIVSIIVIIAAVLIWKFYPGQQIKTGPESIKSQQTPVDNKKQTPKSIAVLPFDDFSQKKDQGYFVDGLSEEILNTIAQIPDLVVMARTSSFSFKGKDKTIQEIANELGVNHLLEGSVRKAGNSIRITAQLIKAVDGSHIWSKTYDRELKDIFKIQEDIAAAVAEELKITLGVGLSLKSLGGTENIKAYELYLNALGILHGSDHYPSVGYSALTFINEAIDQAPEFALAWAKKSYVHALLNLFGPSNRSLEEANNAYVAAQKCIELEPDLADGYLSLGIINFLRGEWLEAEINYRKGIELKHQVLSGDDQLILPFYLSAGKVKEVQKLLENMRRNDPINQNFLAWYYITYGLLGDRQRVEDEYKNRNKLMSKGDSDWHDEAITMARLGSGDKLSIDEIVSPDPITVKIKSYLNSPKEGIIKLRQIYNNESDLSSAELTRIYIWAAYLGDTELALDALDRGTRISMDTLSCWYPVFHDARQLQRFKDILRGIGLVDYWKKSDNWGEFCHPVGDDDFVCE